MKQLTLVRHAKSSWDYPDLSDFERPLNERGRRDAPRMAQRAQQWFGRPDRLVSSPALRAITTAQVFADTLGIHPHDIEIQPRIYEASVATLMTVVRGLDETCTQVVLFGHNPGLSRLAHHLARCDFDEMPTCGMVQLSLDIRQWRDAAPHCGTLLRYTYPKAPTDL